MVSEFIPLILVRGGGDLASGVALRLHRAGFGVVITEINQPLMVRRKASFAQAVYDVTCDVEGVKAVRCANPQSTLETVHAGNIALLVDPEAECRKSLPFDAMVDGRMMKNSGNEKLDPSLFTIGLGPGFVAGIDCNAVIETNRGPYLGRVYWQGSAQPDTGIPESVGNHQLDRVLRAPADGILQANHEIGDLLHTGDLIASVNGSQVKAPFDGVLRGLLQPGLTVPKGMKIGDLDPRCDTDLSFLASDKALAVGGGVLEALLSQADIRKKLAAGK